jgi:hypothetical protein
MNHSLNKQQTPPIPINRVSLLTEAPTPPPAVKAKEAGVAKGKVSPNDGLVVGGRLAQFLPHWEKLDMYTANNIRLGLRLPFMWKPPLRISHPHYRPVSDLIQVEVLSLLKKKAIIEIPPQTPVFTSQIFLVPKPEGKVRLIVDLSPLNKYLQTCHFTMTTLYSVKLTLPVGAWCVNLDLQDAYLHVPVHPDHRPYLAFWVGSKLFQFQVLPFGLADSPRAFVKVCRPILRLLRSSQIACLMYLDDWLVWGMTKEDCLQASSQTLNILESLGWLINYKKSTLTPTQVIQWLGLKWDLIHGRIVVPITYVNRLKGIITSILQREKVSRRQLESLTGSLLFCTNGLEWGLHFLHPIYHWMNSHTTTSTRDVLIHIDQMLISFLGTWLRMDFIQDAAFLKQDWPIYIVMTDASKTGYGASWKRESLSGCWGTVEKRHHINWLEMQTVVLALRHWGAHWSNGEVRILTDNATVVASIRKQGSNKFLHYQKLLHEIWNLAQAHQFKISAEFLPGWLNVKADILSRGVPLPSEWKIDHQTFLIINKQWGPFDVDLCATPDNTQLPFFISPFPCDEALDTNVLAVDWVRWKRIYIFPPNKLIPKLLPLLRRHAASVTLIAPWWPAQDWTLALQNIFPFKTPLQNYQLSQIVQNVQVFHPDPNFWHLHVWSY